MDIQPYNDIYYDAWQEFVYKYGNLYHDLRWKAIIENTYKLKSYYQLIFHQNELIGLLPFFYSNKNTLISNPYLSYCGPLFKNDLDISAEDFYRLISEKNDIKKITIRSLDNKPLDVEISDNNFYVTMIKHLETNSEESFQKLHYKQRNMIRKAYQEAFELKVSSVNDFYKIYTQATNSLGTPPHKKAFFEHIANEFKNDVRINSLYHNNIHIGTIFEIDYKNTRYDMWAFSLKKFLKFKPNIFLYWETLKDAMNKGIEYYDFGRSTYKGSTFLFKGKWNSYPVRLNYSVIDFHSGTPIINEIQPVSGKIFSKVWTLMPDLFTNFIGPKIRKYIY